MFKLEFRTDNAAFDPSPEAEAARLLREIADWLDAGPELRDCTRTIMDTNGNRVGSWSLVNHREE